MRIGILLIFLISPMILAFADSGNQTNIRTDNTDLLVFPTWVLAGGTIAIGITTIITLIKTNRTHQIQIGAMVLQNKITALMEVFKTLSDEEHRNARRITYKAKREYDKSKDIGVFSIRPHYKEVAMTVSFFNQIGELIKKDFIPKEEFFDLHADTTILCWKSLKDYVKHQQEKRKSMFYMNQFVWLGEESLTYWKEKRPHDPEPELF